MTIGLRAGETSEDVRAAIAPIFHYFGVAPRDEAVNNFTTLMTPSRVLLVDEDGATVGGCGSFPLQLTTPGGQVRACGLSMVGVMPTHRRRGVLSAMVRRMFEDARARNEAVAYLWASEERIYGRYGFGLTGLSGDIDVARDHGVLLAAPVPEAKVRRVEPSAALDHASMVFSQVAARAPGAFTRNPDWWRLKTLADPIWRRQGGGEMQCALVDLDGAPAGYAFYRMNFDTSRGVPTGTVQVLEAVGTSPRANAAVWRYLLETDWIASIKADYVPLDHFLLLAAQEPRRLNLRIRDGGWLRILDLPQALSARAYGLGEPLVVEITDAECPWNAGRWSVSEGGIEKTDHSPDLRCGIDSLACVYLGGFTWRHLVASGRAFATDDEAILRADRVFEPRGAPWCPEIF